MDDNLKSMTGQSLAQFTSFHRLFLDTNPLNTNRRLLYLKTQFVAQ